MPTIFRLSFTRSQISAVGDTQVLRAETDILLDDLPDDLVVRILEDHTGFLPHLPEILCIVRIHAVYADRSACGEKKGIDVFCQRRFSGAVVPQHCHELAALYVEVNVRESFHDAFHIAFLIFSLIPVREPPGS
jgi:hypothetical protein